MKNLSEVLNEVMTDIFTEGLFDKAGEIAGNAAAALTPDGRPRDAYEAADAINRQEQGLPPVQYGKNDQFYPGQISGATAKVGKAIGVTNTGALADALGRKQDREEMFKTVGDRVTPKTLADEAQRRQDLAQAEENLKKLDPTYGAADPSYLDRAKEMAADAGNYLAQKGQEAAAAYQSMHPALQYGIPAAALAAGAGALYLRKKQKAANKAAGIR